MGLTLCPVTQREAFAFVAKHHRHHKPPRGSILTVGVEMHEAIVGVAIVGRSLARHLQDGYTAEVTRLCVLESARNACSMLYAACWRAWRALGGRRLVTYTLPEEGGVSLRAAGWRLIGETGGGTWSRKDRRASTRIRRSQNFGGRPHEQRRPLSLPRGDGTPRDGQAPPPQGDQARPQERALDVRVASQVTAIRHWQVIEGDYTAAPDIEATWFVDPPYQRMGKHYVHGSRGIDYSQLAAWCRSRQGQPIVCEHPSADWLPFRRLGVFKAGPAKQRSAEAVWP